jgi:RNA polymerase primary sigma factor
MTAEAYRHAAIKQLRDQQVRLASPERRWEMARNAELLAEELEAERGYPLDYLCFRLTGFRPEGGRGDPGALVQGEDARHDVRLFLDDLAATVAIPLEQATEPVLTVEEVGRRYNVSARTVARWRRQGLAARRFKIGGRAKVGFLQSSVARFVAAHQKQVERGGKFRLVGEDEREEIIRRARRLKATAVGPVGLVEIARRIARTMERSTETIRSTLRAYDREHPDRAIFPETSGPLDDATKQVIASQHRRGISVEVLARQYKRTRSSIYRVVNEVRANKLLAGKLEFMMHESFEKARTGKNLKAEILAAEAPVPPDAPAPRKARAPKGLPPYLASLYEVPLLTREQEMHLFRKMNFLKYLANFQREQLDPAKAKSTELDEIELLQEQALEVKNLIISANLRLVVSIAKRHVGPSNNFFELVSDGNMSLIRAVEKFDWSRGNKFSTYASWAIMKNFARTIPEENYRRDRFVTGHEEMFDSAADTRTDELEIESTQKRMQDGVKGMLSRLEERERRIIMSRFGLAGSREMTLEQLGRELGITKERVRQIEARAQEKLRKIAKEEKLDLPL